MGGTLGSSGSPLRPIAADTFLALLQRDQHRFVPANTQVTYHVAAQIRDSSELEFGDWLQLADQIAELAQQGVERFVIIHGTDTLAYAAAALYHLLGEHYSIVLTGSQLPLYQQMAQTPDWSDTTLAQFELHPQSDALGNLCDALSVAVHQSAGVYLSFAGQCFHGYSAQKIHTTDWHAFTGQDATLPVAVPSLNALNHLDTAARLQLSQLRLWNILLYPQPVKLMAAQLAALAEHAPDVLILQAFGSGNLPCHAAIQQALKMLIQHGCRVILSTQVTHGPLNQDYAAGAWLADCGVEYDWHVSVADSYVRCLLQQVMRPVDAAQ